ncbi:MAG: ABC transporter substrate-binding protein [Planctomycetaceae bacterium]
MTSSSTSFSLRAISFWLILCGFVSGCPKVEEKPAAVTKPFSGTTIVVAAPAGYQFAANWRILLDEWSEQTGATAEVREYPAGPADQPIDQLLAPEVPNSLKDADLLIFSPTEFGELGGAKRLMTLVPEQKPVLERIHWIDLFQGLRENGASLQRFPTVVPLASPVLVLYYRRDLLEKAGLKPPRTWEDYQKLLDTLDKWAPGLTAVEPWSENFRATMFLARAVNWVKHPENYSVFFNIDDGAPLIDSPGFVRALEATLAAVARMPKEVRDYSPADCRKEIFAGKAALATCYERGPAGGQVEALTRKEGIQVGVVRLPGTVQIYNRSTNSWNAPRDEQVNHVTLTGFAGMCGGVASASPSVEAQAAWSLLATLAIDRYESAFSEMPRSPTRKSHTGRPEAWSGPELVADEPLQYLDAVADSLQDHRLVVELPVVGARQFRQALTVGIGKALADPGDPRKRLQEIAAEWNAIVEKVGAKRVANSYRRVLGLPPLTDR